MRRVRLQISMPVSLYRRLERVSRRTGRSIGELVEEAVKIHYYRIIYRLEPN